MTLTLILSPRKRQWNLGTRRLGKITQAHGLRITPMIK